MVGRPARRGEAARAPQLHLDCVVIAPWLHLDYILITGVVVGEQAQGHVALRAQSGVRAVAVHRPRRVLQLRAGSTWRHND